MFRYVLLGLLQGLTEFLPVSSSGHLVLAQKLLGGSSPGVALEAAAHLGTLLALLLHFRGDLVGLGKGLFRSGGERRYVGLLLLGTFPIVVVGLLFHDVVERAFSSARFVGGMLLGTGLVLVFAQRSRRKAREKEVGPREALGVGLAQALALLPGISRSGITVAAGLGLGLRASEAARFSFLLAIPAIAGASLFSLLRASALGQLRWVELAVTFACAFATGVLAIYLFLGALRAGMLWPFALYCGAIGLAALLL